MYVFIYVCIFRTLRVKPFIIFRISDGYVYVPVRAYVIKWSVHLLESTCCLPQLKQNSLTTNQPRVTRAPDCRPPRISGVCEIMLAPVLN